MDIDRRHTLRLMALAPWAAALGAHAQPRTGRPLRVAFLGTATAAGWASQWDAFRQGLHELGWVEGRDVVYETRFAENRMDQLPRLAAELVASRIDLLVTHGIPGTRAAKAATSTVPILMGSVADPVAAGLVSSFSRPEANVTGVAFLAHEMAAKRLQLLKEALPRLGQAAVLSNPRNAAFSQAMFAAMSEAARAVNVQLQLFDAAEPAEYAKVFADMTARRMEAVAITEEATLIANASPIAALAQQHRLPSVGNKEFAQAGGLIGYGANRDELFRRAATLADRLLRGARPADVPVEQPTRFELVLNQRSARAIGVSLPQAMALRADETIA
jgi:putative ABC transport system substrate-binding protein